MLNIKLPKGKMATACEHASQYHSCMNEAKHMNLKTENDLRFLDSLYILIKHHEVKAQQFLDMADACKFSTGDVYVSFELWNEIKGFYDG